jgi:hypothetical protein
VTVFNCREDAPIHGIARVLGAHFEVTTRQRREATTPKPTAVIGARVAVVAVLQAFALWHATTPSRTAVTTASAATSAAVSTVTAVTGNASVSTDATTTTRARRLAAPHEAERQHAAESE